MTDRSKNPQAIAFFDGECGLRSRSVRLVAKMDKKDLFQFAPLRGETARAKLPANLRQSPDLETLVLQDSEGQIFLKSDAVLRILIRIGGVLRIAALGRAIHPSSRDWAYDRVAANRRRIFPSGACAFPDLDLRRRLLD